MKYSIRGLQKGHGQRALIWLPGHADGEFHYCSVLEFTVGPNADARHKVKDEGPAVVNYRRSDPDKVPVRSFVGPLVKRGEAMKNYVPSLDPVRVAGKVVTPPAEQ